MPLYDYQLAAGYNNAVGLANIETLAGADNIKFHAPQCFGSYTPGERLIRGDGTDFLAGFPFVVWLISGITAPQIYYLSNTYCGAALSGKVTIRTTTNQKTVYANYNAVMRLPFLPDARKITSGFGDFAIRMTRLTAL